MMTIKRVKDFNREANLKYRFAVDNYKFGTGGFPYLPLYTFNLENGEERKNGYVAVDKHSYKFFLYKKDLAKFINDKPNREFQVEK